MITLTNHNLEGNKAVVNNYHKDYNFDNSIANKFQILNLLEDPIPPCFKAEVSLLLIK